MIIRVLKNETYTENSNLPTKATERSTGYDLIATSDPEIVGHLHPGNSTNIYTRIDYIQYRTNLKMEVIKDLITRNVTVPYYIDYDVLAFPRSSVSKYNLLLANSIGLLDADYRGEVLLRFKYIWQPEDLIYVPTPDGNKSGISSKIVGIPNLDKIYKKGDKICQLKATRVENIEFRLVDELDTSERAEGGFGSTDLKTDTKQQISIESMYKSYKGAPEPTKPYSRLVQETQTNLTSYE